MVSVTQSRADQQELAVRFHHPSIRIFTLIVIHSFVLRLYVVVSHLA
jgi:hypothetical protein